MKILTKSIIALLIIFISILSASLFGIFHNLISYEVSHEFFENWLFGEFGMGLWGNNDRQKDAVFVGVMSSWWIGFFIGCFYAAIYLFLKTKNNLINMLKAITINLITATLGSLIGYLSGSFIPIEKSGVFIDFGTEFSRNYVQAAYMHNGSYMGAFAGLIVSIIYLIIQNNKK